jgi:hypothetical protein
MRLISGSSAIGILASVTLSTLGSAYFAESIMERQVRMMLAGFPNVTAGTIVCDPWSGRVVVDKATINAGKIYPTIRIGKISATLGAPKWPFVVSAAAAAPSTVTFENISSDLGPYQIEIPLIVITGASASQQDIAAIFGANATGSIAERLATLSASAIKIPTLRLVHAILGPASRGSTTFKDIGATDLAAGRIASVTIATTESDSKIQMRNSAAGNPPDAAPPMMEFTGSYGAVRITNLDVAAILRLATEIASGDQPLVPLYDSYVIDGFKLAVVTPQAHIDISGGRVSGAAKARPLRHSLANLLTVSRKRGAGEEPTVQDLADAFATLSDVLTAFAVSAELNDLTYNVRSMPNPAGGKIARISMSLGDNGALAETIEGFSLDSASAHVGVERLGFSGLLLGPAARAFADAAAHGEDGIKGADPRVFIPALAQVLVSGIELNAPAPSRNGNADDGNRFTAGMGRFEWKGANFIGAIPTAVSATLDHLKAGLPTSEQNLKDWIALGYNKLDLSWGIALAWDEATQQIAVNLLNVSAEMGTVAVKALIGNVPKVLFTGSASEVQAAAAAVLVKGLDITVQNDGLMQRFIAKQAKDQRKSPEEVKTGMAQIAAMAIPAMLGGAPAARTIVAAALKFIADPKHLQIVARAPDGLLLSELSNLKDPVLLLNRIELSASANE